MGDKAGVYFLNLHDYNLELPFGLRINRDHKSILEVGPLRDFITNLIKDEHTLTRRITKDYPPADASHRLHFSIHSPVTLDLYDAQGNHTGMTPGDSNSDIQFIEEEIPNSYYLKFGEGVYAGADASQKTTLKLKGLSGGTFTLKVEETSGGVSSGFTTFLDIPITKNTIATMEISTLSDSPILILDMDGDGKNIVNLTVQNGVVVMPKPEEKPAIPATSGGAVSPWFAEHIVLHLHLFRGGDARRAEGVEACHNLFIISNIDSNNCHDTSIRKENDLAQQKTNSGHRR